MRQSPFIKQDLWLIPAALLFAILLLWATSTPDTPLAPPPMSDAEAVEHCLKSNPKDFENDPVKASKELDICKQAHAALKKVIGHADD